MWCPVCQQDTPPVAAISDELAVCCALCGGPFGEGEFDEAPLDDAALADDDSLESAAALLFDTSILDLHDWRLENDLADAERLIHSLRTAGPELAHEEIKLPPRDEASARGMARREKKITHQRGAPPLAVFCSWAALSLGVMTFAAGAVLLGWSFFAGRSELWSYGLPMTLAGQAGLLIGLILQLEGLWQSNRSTAQSLDALDEQLSDLRQAASLLSTPHNAPSPSFYAHPADGASANLLLADLKGQLDLLAVRLAKERAA